MNKLGFGFARGVMTSLRSPRARDRNRDRDRDRDRERTGSSGAVMGGGGSPALEAVDSMAPIYDMQPPTRARLLREREQWPAN